MSAICCAVASVPSACRISPVIEASNQACTEEAGAPTGAESRGAAGKVVETRLASPA
jgi:hypothetical protein